MRVFPSGRYEVHMNREEIKSILKYNQYSKGESAYLEYLFKAKSLKINNPIKVNIKEMDPDEAYKILKLIAVSFDFKDKERGTDKRGFIAEDVAEIIPQLVTPETEEAPASLNYIEMIPYLQTVIKEQDKRIKALEDKLEELTRKIDLLS